MSNPYSCLATDDKDLILEIGGRKIAINKDKELELLTSLQETDSEGKWDLVYIQMLQWMEDSSSDEGNYYAQKFANEFLRMHGMSDSCHLITSIPKTEPEKKKRIKTGFEVPKESRKRIRRFLLGAIGGPLLFGGGVAICDKANGSYLIVVLGVAVSCLGLLLIATAVGWIDFDELKKTLLGK